MIASPPPSFAPPEDAIDGLLADLARPDISFLDLATRHHTTPEALSLWMTRPGIRERLAASADIITWRTQYVATFQLSSAVSVLSNICTTYAAETPVPKPASIPSYASRLAPDAPPSVPPPAAPIPPYPADLMLKLRRAESARRAATTLLRLTALRPIGAPTISSSRPTTLRPPATTPLRPREDHPTSYPTPVALDQLAPRAAPEPSPHSDAAPSSTTPNPRHDPRHDPGSPPTVPLPTRDAHPRPSPTRLPVPVLPDPSPLPRLTLTAPRRPRSTTSLLDLVGASSGPPDLTFSPRSPWP